MLCRKHWPGAILRQGEEHHWLPRHETLNRRTHKDLENAGESCDICGWGGLHDICMSWPLNESCHTGEWCIIFPSSGSCLSCGLFVICPSSGSCHLGRSCVIYPSSESCHSGKSCVICPSSESCHFGRSCVICTSSGSCHLGRSCVICPSSESWHSSGSCQSCYLYVRWIMCYVYDHQVNHITQVDHFLYMSIKLVMSDGSVRSVGLWSIQITDPVHWSIWHDQPHDSGILWVCVVCRWCHQPCVPQHDESSVVVDNIHAIIAAAAIKFNSQQLENLFVLIQKVPPDTSYLCSHMEAGFVSLSVVYIKNWNTGVVTQYGRMLKTNNF